MNHMMILLNLIVLNFNDNSLLSGFQFGNNEIYIFDDVSLPIQRIEPANQNIPNEAMITVSATQMHANPEIRAKKTYHLFEVKKEKKKLLERRKRNIIYRYETRHNKFEKKDVLTKIKKGSYNNFLGLTNKNIKDSKDGEIKKKQIKLRKVDNSVIEVANKNDNLN